MSTGTYVPKRQIGLIDVFVPRQVDTCREAGAIDSLHALVERSGIADHMLHIAICIRPCNMPILALCLAEITI